MHHRNLLLIQIDHLKKCSYAPPVDPWVTEEVVETPAADGGTRDQSTNTDFVMKSGNPEKEREAPQTRGEAPRTKGELETTAMDPSRDLEGVAVDLEGVAAQDKHSSPAPEPGPCGFPRPTRKRRAPERLGEWV